MKFFIDAGHGGTEPGAIGNGMIEKNINLIVAKEVKRILELNGQKAIISRDSDITLSLENRPLLANQYGVDYFISIHHNANDGKTTGSEVYCSVKGGKGKILADIISNIFIANGRKSKVVQRESETTPNTDYYAVIKRTNMPAIVAEFGYIDSKDYINFDTETELNKEAQMIATGCLNVAGVYDIMLSSFETPQHWAQGHYDYLKTKNIIINETRFDDKITRGEVFALLAQIIKG